MADEKDERQAEKHVLITALSSLPLKHMYMCLIIPLRQLQCSDEPTEPMCRPTHFPQECVIIDHTDIICYIGSYPKHHADVCKLL